MTLNTIQAITADAQNLRDILDAFEYRGYEIDCDDFDSDEVHYSITTPDGYIQVRYDFMVGVCHISADEDEDLELVIHFSITRRYISD